MRHPLNTLLTLCAATLILTSCTLRDDDYRSAQGAVWGTTYHITYKSHLNLGDSIVAVMRSVEKSLSPFDSTSIISQINRGIDARPDSMLIAVFAESQRINRLSNGAFDPTVAPLVNLWGFGYRNPSTQSAPSQQAIDSALTLVGINRCSITPNGHIKKPTPATEFNFSAITKGFGVDCVASMLRRNGCTNFMVEIGGEIALAGKNPKNEDWHIQIDAPIARLDTVAHDPLTIIAITDRCIATSGNYRNFHRLPDGTVATHTISPATGRPVVTSTLSATIIAPSTMTADALATATMAMPPNEALKMLSAQPGVDALIVTIRPDSTYNILTTPTFPQPSKQALD